MAQNDQAASKYGRFQLNVSGFTDGLNTNASVLNILPSEFMDGTINVELLHNGSVRRRRGIDFVGESVTGGYLNSVRVSTTASEIYQEVPSAVYVRLSAPNGAIVERIVLSINNEFWIYNADNAALREFQAPRQTISRGNNSASYQKFSHMNFAISGTRLFFAGEFCQPGFLYVDTDNETLAVTFLDVLIRDPLATKTNTRTKRTISSIERWYECIEAHFSDTTNAPGDGTGDWQRYWFELDGAPSASATTWAAGNNYTTTFLKRYNKNTTMDNTMSCPTCVNFFAGRLWLAGDPKYPNTIYFSQVVQRTQDLSNFHQYADPFDTDDPDVVADDGGKFDVQGAGLVYAMLSSFDSVFIGANNGVWQVIGENGKFKATTYSVNNILRDPVIGYGNMILANQEAVVFGQNCVWTTNLKKLNQIGFGNASFNSILEFKNLPLWEHIPLRSKQGGRALYNDGDGRVYYFYNDLVTEFDRNFNNRKQPGYATSCLIFDLGNNADPTKPVAQREKRTVENAIFKYEFADTGHNNKPYIACPFIAPEVPPANQTVTDNSGSTVVNATGATVTASGQEGEENAVLFVALERQTLGTDVTIKGAFGTLEGGGLKDWYSSEEFAVSYTSRIISGVQTAGDILHRKGGTYIYFVFKKVEDGVLDEDTDEDTNPGGCYLRTAWQFATSTASAKYSDQRQIYFPDRFNIAMMDATFDGHDHTWFKHRVRGFGNSLQIILENEDDKDFHVVGWSQQFWGKND